jgi:hypothetical protein
MFISSELCAVSGVVVLGLVFNHYISVIDYGFIIDF